MSLQNLNDGIVIFSDMGNVMFTSTGEVLDNKKPIRKHKINKNIVHGIFNEMRKLNDNEYWDKFLHKCARNIFPNKDFKFINDVLYYKIKTKKHRAELYIDEDNLEDSFNNLKQFLREKGIKPNSEVTEKENLYKKDFVVINDWKSVGKELKSDKILEFITREKEKNNLNYYEEKQLESILKTAISGEILNNDNIMVKDNTITEIKYLLWLEEERKYKIDIDNITIKFSKTAKTKNDNNYYTYNSYTNENYTFNKEMKKVDIGKKWENFLEKIYNKNGLLN